jgi:hypothetical protein
LDPRETSRLSLAAEVEQLVSDDADREEMQIVGEHLAELAPESDDWRLSAKPA